MTANATDPPLASQGRRLAGAVLDGLIFVLTLGIGWVIWYLVAAGGGAEPGEAAAGHARHPRGRCGGQPELDAHP